MVEKELITIAVLDARAELVNDLICSPCDFERAETSADCLLKAGCVSRVTPSLIDHFCAEAKHDRAEATKTKLTDPEWVDVGFTDCSCGYFADINGYFVEQASKEIVHEVRALRVPRTPNPTDGG